MDATLHSAQLELGRLTPQTPLPTEHDMRDEPGVTPFKLLEKNFREYIRFLPRGKAAGTLLTTYELITAVSEAGASDGYLAFFTAFTAGALHSSLAELVIGIRAVLLDKQPGCRPLGIGEAERRVGCALIARQKKKKWNAGFTTEPGLPQGAPCGAKGGSTARP